MIEVRNLEKSYGPLNVLKDISIPFQKGKITAILGPNAAGKSTLIKCILGLVQPDSGDIRIEDETVISKTDYRNKIGYVPQKIQFPYHLRVKDLFKIVMEVRGKDADLDLDLYSCFKINELEKKFLVTLSGGTLQKINAAIGFLFSAKILILDEPTVGLDPLAVYDLKKKIMAEKEKGKTIILTSHIPDIVERFSDNIIFLHEGTVLFNDSLDCLFQMFKASALEDCIFQLMKSRKDLVQ